MTERVRDVLVRGTIVVALGVVVAMGWRHQRRGPVVAGTLVPAFRAESVAGDTVSLASFRGQVLLVNAWATWCVPCREEMPALERLYRRLGPRGLRIVAVSEDLDSPGGLGSAGVRATVRAFVQSEGLTFPVLLDPAGQLQDSWGIPGLPTTFLIGRNGRVVRRLLGAKRWDEPPYSTDVETLLEG